MRAGGTGAAHRHPGIVRERRRHRSDRLTPAAAPTGVSYVVTPGGPYDGTVTNVVTVTATLSNGQAWGRSASGWIEADPTTATYSVTLAAASCTSVTPRRD